MQIPKPAEIVIIGGGVMGASTAYHLAARDQKDVLLLEKEQFFGQGATGRCAGGIRYQFGTEVNVRLSIESLPMLERFAEIVQAAMEFVVALRAPKRQPGDKGGQLVASGTPQDIALDEASHTGRYLAKMIRTEATRTYETRNQPVKPVVKRKR